MDPEGGERVVVLLEQRALDDVGIDPDLLERAAGRAVMRLEGGEQQVLGAEDRVAVAAGDLVGPGEQGLDRKSVV